MFYTYIKGNPFLTRKLRIIGSFCLKAVIPLYRILREINVIYSKVLNFAQVYSSIPNNNYYNLKKKNHFCYDKGTLVILSIDSCSVISRMSTIIFT